MKLELEHNDLIKLVKGQEPYYDVMDHKLIKQCGRYYGGFHDKWMWDTSELFKLTDEELWQVYQICKHSWK